MPNCRVHFRDRFEIWHEVEIPDVSNVYEGAARALYLFTRYNCPPADDIEITVEVETRST